LSIVRSISYQGTATKQKQL